MAPRARGETAPRGHAPEVTSGFVSDGQIRWWSELTDLEELLDEVEHVQRLREDEHLLLRPQTCPISTG
jgi:hypothetical protein